MSLGAALVLLIALQTKHLVADYLFQTPYMFRNKGTYLHPGGLLHVLLHGALTLGVLWVGVLGVAGTAWGVVAVVVIAEMLVHYHIDWTKEFINKRNGLTPEMARFWHLQGLDQWLHQLTYVAMIAVLVGG
ncbi:DUF3307 domain-containing protein [Rhodobacteraceae bacterium D3-12]|nr:DUF3307 domain-containing protein [Rhodobacteraceae bacterium D3-12]